MVTKKGISSSCAGSGSGDISRKVPPAEGDSAESHGLRRSARENAWGKQPSSISKTPVKMSDDLRSSIPKNIRRSERLEKLSSSPVKKKTSEEKLTPKTTPVKNKFQISEECETPPLRRSERNKNEAMSNPSGLKRKWMDSRTYQTLFSSGQGTSRGDVKNDMETVLDEKLSSRYVEYWVPVSISNVQLEQYCAVLLANSINLRSCSKNDLVGAMLSTYKCCDHPYTVDPSLQRLLVKELSPPECLDVGIKASGKLQLLDTILSEIRNKGLRVLILFQYISGSGRDTIGDILDDFLLQRFGQDSYERIDGGLPQHMKQASVNKFNDKNSNRFVFLLEIRACQSSIKLSSVDGIIFFDSDWNPSLDLKALNRISINSCLKKIKVFRLYSPFTLEEKVLILAAQNVTLDNRFHNIKRSNIQQLLKWGASYLFKKLDLFHDVGMTCSDISLEASILKDVAHEFLGLLSSHDEVHMENSLIVKVKHNEGTYNKNIQLFGERELLNVLDESQLFWENLLDGRSPKWKYPSGLLQKNRKRVNFFDEPSGASKGELDVAKKRKKTCNIPISPFPELEHEASKGELGVTTKKRKKTCNIPISPELEQNETEPIEKDARDSVGLQSVCITHSLNGEASEMPQSFHLLLKSNLEKVYEVLQLHDDVKIMAVELLNYIIDNHHISREPESIFQAFQISLCWNAASLVKNKIDKDKSLAMVKKHLNFSCTEEEAYLVYSKMRNIRKMFLQYTHGLKESKYSKDVILITADDPIGLPLAERVARRLQALNVLNAELQQNFLRQFSLEKGIESHFKKIKKNYEKNMERLLLRQQKEIDDMGNKMKQKREEINTDYRIRAAVIRSIRGKFSVRSDKLKKIEEDLGRRIEEHKQQKEICLKELEEKHVCEKIVEMKKAADKFEKLKSLSPADFHDDSALPVVAAPTDFHDNSALPVVAAPSPTDFHDDSALPVVADEHVLSIYSMSVSCAKEQIDKTLSTSDEPTLVSSGTTTCIDDQSSRQPVYGTVEFTLKPNGSSDIDTFPGVLNRESEQQPHCNSAYTTGNLEQAPNKDLSSSSKVPSKSSSTLMEVTNSIIATELIAVHCEADSIIVTELVATHCEADKTSLVVVDGMKKQNDNTICCEDPRSVNRESLESLVCTQAIVDSQSVSRPIDPTCDKLLQVELPLLLNVPGPIDKTHGGQPVTIEMESLRQESLAGLTVITDLSNVSRRNDQNYCEHIGNVDSCSSQQVSIAGSQTGADSCNTRVDLHRASDVVERTPTTDNAILTPASVIAGSQDRSDSYNNEADLDRVSDVIKTTPPTDNAILPPVSNSHHTVRSLTNILYLDVFPLGQGTQLPPMTSNLSNHNSFRDPLQMEADRLSKEMKQFKKILNDKRSVIESARAKELEEIHKKYNAEIHETETVIASNINELHMRRDVVLKNKLLADAFRAKCDLRSNGLSSISNMQQLPTIQSLVRQTTNGTSSTPSQTNSEIPIAPSSLTHSVQQSAPMISTLPIRAPHRVSLTPPTVNRQVREEIPIASSPHPWSVLQSAPIISSMPAKVPSREFFTPPTVNLQVHKEVLIKNSKILPIAPSPLPQSALQSAPVISSMPAKVPSREFFTPPTVNLQVHNEVSIENCKILPIAPSPLTKSVLQSAPMISSMPAKVSSRDFLTPPTVNLQVHNEVTTENCEISPIALSPLTESVLLSAPIISNKSASTQRGASLTPPTVNLQVCGERSMAASQLTQSVLQSAPIISSIPARRRASFTLPPINLNLEVCGERTITSSLPTHSVMQSAPMISNMSGRAPFRASLIPPPINLQVRKDMRAPAPHLRFKPSSYPVAPYNRPAKTNVYGIPDEFGNPLLRPVGSIASTGNRYGLQTPSRVNPVTPTGFPTAHPITPDAFSSVHPIMPQNPTEFGGAIKVEINAPHNAPLNMANEVVCLSDDEDAVSR